VFHEAGAITRQGDGRAAVSQVIGGIQRVFRCSAGMICNASAALTFSYLVKAIAPSAIHHSSRHAR
jgi:hypothetical protein